MASVKRTPKPMTERKRIRTGSAAWCQLSLLGLCRSWRDSRKAEVRCALVAAWTPAALTRGILTVKSTKPVKIKAIRVRLV